MSALKLHTLESAPAASKTMLEESNKAFGMIPNLHAVMAESPQHLEAYKNLHELFSKSSLTDTERTVVWMVINVENECHYCVPAHSAIAKMQGIADATVQELREAKPLSDAKLEALRQFTLAVMRQRGNVTGAPLDAFFAAGYTQANVLDVILGLAQKTLSNYVNHIAKTPVDEPFTAFAWQPSS